MGSVRSLAVSRSIVVARRPGKDDVVRAAEEHVKRDHPELVGKITREDLLAMTESV